MPREIVVDWITASGPGKVSVTWWDLTATVAAQRTALATFLGAVDGTLDNSTTWTIRTVGRELDDSTGGLIGAWAEGSVKTGTGNNATEPVADATQILFQWHTGNIVNGRFLRGRTFIPGLTNSVLSNGNINEANRAAFQALGETLVDDAANMQVWHRPVSGTGGSAHTIANCTVWAELAVLRRRRS